MSNIGNKIDSLENVQEKNTESAIRNIERSQQILDQLINTSDDVHELRSIRKKLSTLISDLKDKNLSQFSNKTSSMNDFTIAEEYFVNAFEDFADELKKQSLQGVNTKNIKVLMKSLEYGINSRLIPTDELINQSQASTNKEESRTGLIPQDLKNELHLYLNMLQTKYSKNRPEILFGGDYVGDMNWKYVQEHDHIKAKSGSMLDVPLVLEARFQQKDVRLIEQIQKEASKVKKGQHKCVCLINREWDDEIKDFALRFMHPNFVLYLHDLEDGLIFNKENEIAEHYSFWFNTEQGMKKLDELVQDFIEDHEYFTEYEVAEAIGLNTGGAKKMLKGLVDNGVIIDVSFESEKIKKYTRTKPKD